MVPETDLAAWLFACIEDDTQVATAALNWHASIEWAEDAAEAFWDRFTAERMLVECDTKRRIIELHAPAPDAAALRPDGPRLCVACGDEWPCQTLRLQTLPFVDREGYLDVWAPDGR